MKKKSLWKMLAVFAAAGTLCAAACGIGMTAAAEEETEAGTQAASAAEGKSLLTYAEQMELDDLGDGVFLLTDGYGNQRLLAPAESEIPEGYEDLMVIRTPVEKPFYCSTTHISMIDALDDDSLFDRIGAVNMQADAWFVPEVTERMENGSIAYIAHDEQQPGNLEEILELGPDLVIVNAGEAGMQLGAQLEEVGIPFIVDASWMEAAEYGELEWIKLFGALYGMEEKANDIFEAKVAKVEELKEMTAQLPEEEKPTVAVGTIRDGVMYAQGNGSSVAKTVADAGGIYAESNLEGDGSMQVSMEEFVDSARDADILIYPSMIQYTPDKAYLADLEPLLAEFKAFQEDQVYVYTDDFYMSNAAVEEKFQDMVAILHPELFEGYELKHYVRLPDAAE